MQVFSLPTAKPQQYPIIEDNPSAYHAVLAAVQEVLAVIHEIPQPKPLPTPGSTLCHLRIRRKKTLGLIAGLTSKKSMSSTMMSEAYQPFLRMSRLHDRPIPLRSYTGQILYRLYPSNVSKTLRMSDHQNAHILSSQMRPAGISGVVVQDT